MKKTIRMRTRARLLPRLGNERGMLLVLTMIMLLVISTLAAASLINAFLEKSLARNQNYASIALNAADAGISVGLDWLNNPANTGGIPTTNAYWKRPGDPVTRTLASGGSYELTIEFKSDTEDGDQDCNTINGTPAVKTDDDIVFFNRAALDLADVENQRPNNLACDALNNGYFAYKDSLFRNPSGAEQGYPIITIVSRGSYKGAAYREVWMDVARNRLMAQVEGAFTARSGVTATGSSFTDGRNHDLDGNLVVGGTGCNADKPGVMVNFGETPPACPSANLAGNPCSAVYPNPPPAGKSPLSKTPWGQLGLTEAQFSDMFTKVTTDQMLMPDCYDTAAHTGVPNYVWFSGTGGVKFNNASTCTDYAGILVVHNEGFDPDTWEATCTMTPLSGPYCTDPANKPAVFDMNGDVSWTGIIIADQVVKVNGNPTVRGGIISLASGGIIDSTITGNITIEYSCEAVSGAVNQGYKTRLGWRRVR